MAAGLILAPSALAQPHPDDLRGIEAAERSVRSSQPAAAPPNERRTPVLLNNRPIGWEDLQPSLAEAAGAIVLQEVILDRLLDAELRLRGVEIGPDLVARERQLLLETIVQEARASAEDAERLLAGVRRSRGLGEQRFGQLLLRNARLRALVAPEIEIDREEIDREFLIRHGPRTRARVIMTATQRQAIETRSRLAGETENLKIRFAEAAATVSIDPSSERGGIVDPISPADPSYPSSIRRTLEHLLPGELSPVVAVDQGFALLLVEEKLPGDGVELKQVEDRIRTDLRRREERLAMDVQARRMLREADVTIMDRSLDWAWRGVRGER